MYRKTDAFRKHTKLYVDIQINGLFSKQRTAVLADSPYSEVTSCACTVVLVDVDPIFPMLG